MSTRRVVITGVGLINSLGLNVQDSWLGILSGKSGIKPITSFDTSKFSCKIASIVSGFNPENYIAPREIQKMNKFIHFGIAASIEAIEDSGWKPLDELSRDKTGVILGSGIGGLSTIEETAVELQHSERSKVSPYFIPASLVNLLSGHVSIKYNFSGPNHAVSTACSTGTHAIGDAVRIIQYGDADVMVAGGAEAPITPVGIAGFSAAKSLSINFNDKPTQASRPWDRDRTGFVMGEGAGVVVLEEYQHAVKRGAKIYAEVVGYGLSGDAFHITAPNGRGAIKAMQNALKDAKVNLDQVNYINAHGTSTKVGDVIELQAVQTLFHCHNSTIKMSSTKSSIGHLLGATGSVEAIFTALAIRDQVAPPTLNLYNPIKEAQMNLVPLVAQETVIKYALSNSFGFGGTNASILLCRV